jgi:hypothetical protein
MELHDFNMRNAPPVPFTVPLFLPSLRHAQPETKTMVISKYQKYQV